MRGRQVDLAQAAGALLAPQGRRAVHRLGLDRDHARSGRRLDQRLDLSRAGARQEQGHDPVRPSRAGTARSSPRNTGTGASPARSRWSTARTRRCSSRASNICPTASRNTTSPAPSRARRSRCSTGPLTGLPLPAQAEIILEGELLPAEQDHAAGRPVRRVHRLLRRRRAALPGDAGQRHPSPRRSDPARLAADEAAALPLRPAVPRRLDLEQSGNGRRHRRGRRLAACGAAHDGGGAQAALRRPRQARGADRRRQQLHGPAGRGGGRRRRSVQPRRRDVGDHHALRAVGADRHRAQRLELGARSAHPGGGQGRRHHLAFQGDHRGGAAVRLEGQVPADLGADRRRGPRDRDQVGRCDHRAQGCRARRASAVASAARLASCKTGIRPDGRDLYLAAAFSWPK